MPYSDNQSS